MLTRREMLTVLAPAPLLSFKVKRQVQIVEEPHTLAGESCAGFRQLLQRNTPRGAGGDIIIHPAARHFNGTLLQRVRDGSCLILESGVCFLPLQGAARAAAILHEVFGLRILPSVNAPFGEYVKYSWPLQKQIRSFESVTPVACSEREVISRWRGLPVSCRKQIGNGSVIYLGSMLGPGLYAEEREAHALGERILA